MAETGLVQILEGAMLASDRPLTVQNLAALFEEGARPAGAEIRAALEEIAARCEGRGFELQEVSSGFRFSVRQELSQWVSRLWSERPVRYSRALLETLSLIAYRQPITRGEIEEIRGVAVSTNIIKTLHERDWIRVVGHRDVPGRPAMYATTKQFLDYFNLKHLDELPPLAEIRDFSTLTKELGFEDLADPDAEGAADDAGDADAASDADDANDANGAAEGAAEGVGEEGADSADNVEGAGDTNEAETANDMDGAETSSNADDADGEQHHDTAADTPGHASGNAPDNASDNAPDNAPDNTPGNASTGAHDADPDGAADDTSDGESNSQQG